MNVFEKIKSKNIDELTKWLNEYGAVDDAPWIEWWDNVYCGNCDSELIDHPLFGETECAWCELHNKCRFFEELNNIPDNKQIIKLWLESEG